MSEQEEYNELKTNDVKYSRSLYLKFHRRVCGDAGRGPYHGEYLVGDVVLRFKNGFLDGGENIAGEPMPAIDLPNGHNEWWKEGMIHRDDGPAITTNWGSWEEYWDQGRLILIRAIGPITRRPPEREIVK
jgi:hypothetical protein